MTTAQQHSRWCRWSRGVLLILMSTIFMIVLVRAVWWLMALGAYSSVVHHVRESFGVPDELAGAIAVWIVALPLWAGPAVCCGGF